MPQQKIFKLFIDQHTSIISKICRAYSNDDQEFEDYFQEVTLQLWKSFNTFRGESKASTWVYRIALNVCLSQIRKRKKRIKTTVLEHTQIKDEGNNNEREVQIANLYVAIKKIKETDRALILLYLEDKSYKEIAEIMGLTVSNVGAKINRIKTQLKKLIPYG
ncbi:MAG: RNA polymerase [Thalassobius sp.]|nr:RNA polymerase [Thalassovita sp.]